MDGTIVNSSAKMVSVRVIDRDGYTHFVGLAPNGDFVEHTSDDLPYSPDEYTDEVKERIERVVKYARFIFAQRYPSKDVLDPTDNPAVLRRALRVLESMRVDQFEDEFTEYRSAMIAPSPGDWEYGKNFAPEEVVLVYQPLYFNPDVGLVANGESPRYVCANDEELTFIGDEISAPVVIKHEPLRLAQGLDDVEPDADGDVDVETDDVEKPNPEEVSMDVFRDFVREQLESQIAECYVEMGCNPPAEFSPDSFGRI